MSLLSVVITLLVIGLLLYFINSYLPIDAKIKKLINLVVIVAVVFWLISVFFGFGPWNLEEIKIPRAK
jgi:hypothetical protein